ncbi:MarR family transcriptional regulator [Gammaproteobacteria bacterium]|jgi:DNA-binding MarR family transcriptional regulator|nr:MarR family transcriptional regulator [Gammaproteobacteria bacterium]MDB4252913.1 MarR family transcriptional regulator [Gammaproteobacteria bacterium]MDC1190596.1 MarR family transcriptional regulator [Gammaproteobacteria bacterium]
MVDNNNYKTFLEGNFLRLILEVSEWMEAEMIELNKNSEYQGSPAEIKIFNALRGKEKSISELARSLGISRQAVHKKTHRLKELGYLDLISSNDNKKDRLIVITEKGQAVRKQGADHLIKIEEKLSWSIGERNFEFMKEILRTHVEKNG